MVSLTLLSTALMGLLVVATFVAVAQIGAKRTAPGAGSASRYDAITETLSDVARKPVVWAVAFVAIAVGVGAVSLLAVGNFGLPEGLSGSLLTVVYAVVGLLLTGFVFLGAYFSVRGRGLGNAHGVAAGSFAAGLVFLILIVAQLLIGVIG
ncbi:hypothetical protein [Halorubrum lacusprofundi]|jgi:hypothetical protein|uniref:Uncharacterized protein n=1 Tax=Halorubrum lacusprofundi (strain ATCC 49239 / DSM 5036 / JCM 8891 / ACAM 34) TaxID=416348 RepID=B9LUQ7_HALLT|nr:hypothetical protein [Halorubrum lacusprofundi]ACM56384.1 conserved hypothetical protein [Halorubrum lacusprofundi ATCC 49239]MCG1005344.1 hypothetical protein [Halorubrum lacusprofundi]